MSTTETWVIDWYICKEGGKELWRVPVQIGPLRCDHNHWASWHIGCTVEQAHLASAAPDLLAACEDALRMYQTVQPAGGWQGVEEALTQAIAKARGEAQP